MFSTSDHPRADGVAGRHAARSLGSAATGRKRSRRLAAVAVSGVAMLAAMPAIASANQVIAFPERDFLSGVGFTAGKTVDYTVTHTNGSSYPAWVRADLDGLAEVNHPGGVCWASTTPDVRAGDVVTRHRRRRGGRRHLHGAEYAGPARFEPGAGHDRGQGLGVC